MIALLCLLEPSQVLLELFLVGPRGTVNSLQHFVVRIAAPIGARNLHELKSLEFAGARNVRPAAQILPRTLPVQADGFGPAESRQ